MSFDASNANRMSETTTGTESNSARRTSAAHSLHLSPSPAGQPASGVAPAVDVAIPAFRRTAFLCDAIESVLAQTFGAWQLRIVDNGAGGGAIHEVVEPYLSDPRVSYHATGEEIPQAENWTRAISLGTNVYVALLNDDDRWTPNFLLRRVEALEAHPECGFAFGRWIPIDERGTRSERTEPVLREGVVPQRILAHALARENIVGVPTLVVRRSAYESAGAAFDPAWHFIDWEMWARLAARHPAYYVAVQDSEYRVHPASHTYVAHQTPQHLVGTMEHIERELTAHVEGFRLSRLQRARNHSRMLLHVAANERESGGWKACWPFYRRSLREFPPSAFDKMSLVILARTVLRRRAYAALTRTMRRLGLVRAPGAS
jgi:glycosyltransferase involved in cell wall biosynthesis